MSDDNVLDQNEIERLLSGGGGDSAPPPPTPPEAEAFPPDDDGPLSQSDLESLLGSLGGVGVSPATPSTPAPSFTNQPSQTAPFDAGETDSVLGQDDIESLLKGSAPSSPPQHTTPQPSQPGHSTAQAPPSGAGKRQRLDGFTVPTVVTADEEGVPQGDIDYLLRRAEDALESISNDRMDLPTEVVEFQFPEFGGSVPNVEHATLDQISEVELDVKIELGRANMYLEDILKLRKGSVVPLDKMAGEAVDIYVNGRLLARGEVLVMNENFCVRVAELLAGAIPLE